MQNKSNLNMSVGAIPVGGAQRTIGYDVYQNKPIGGKKGSMPSNVNSASHIGARTSSLQHGSQKNGQIMLMAQKKKQNNQQFQNSMMHVNKSVNLGAPSMILNQSYDGKIAYGPNDINLPQTNGAQSMKQSKLQHIYQNQLQGNSSAKANGLTQYQKKMMMKNSNQFRNSYNSVGGVAQMVPGQVDNVRTSVASQKIVSNQGKQSVLLAAYSNQKPKQGKERYAQGYNYDYGQQPPLQTIGHQDNSIQLQQQSNSKFHTINNDSNYNSNSKKGQLLDASKRSGTTGGTSGGVAAQNGVGVRATGNVAHINFGNQNVYSSNEERKSKQISTSKMEQMRAQGIIPQDMYGQKQGVGSRRGLSGSSQGLNHSMSGTSSKNRPHSKVGVRQPSDVAHKISSRRSSNVSGKGSRQPKRGSVRKDTQHQTLTLMPVDQSMGINRRQSGTIDGDMVCFSPSNMDPGVSLQHIKPRAGGAATQSQDRSSQHIKITQRLAQELEGQLLEEVQLLEQEDQMFLSKHEEDNKALDETDAARIKKAGENVSQKYDINKEKETRQFKQKEVKINHSQETDSKKLQMIAKVLGQISQQDKTYMSILGTISESLNEIATKNTIKDEQTTLLKGLYTQSQEFQRRYTNVKQRNESSDKVMSEMKKQLSCYKEEIENMKKMEAHLTVENYQKLVNDFNQLYDHYKMHKQMSKKLKGELSQSNHRERTFLKLLKKTNEFGDQATQLEQEYDKLYDSNEDLSGEQKFIEVCNKIQIPMLDLSIIHIQQQEGEESQSQSQSNATDQSVSVNPNDQAMNDISMIEHSESNIDDADLNADQLIFSKNLVSNAKMGGILQEAINPDIPSESESQQSNYAKKD